MNVRNKALRVPLRLSAGLRGAAIPQPVGQGHRS